MSVANILLHTSSVTYLWLAPKSVITLSVLLIGLTINMTRPSLNQFTSTYTFPPLGGLHMHGHPYTEDEIDKQCVSMFLYVETYVCTVTGV